MTKIKPPLNSDTHNLGNQPIRPTATPAPRPGMPDPLTPAPATDYGEWSLESGLVWDSEREALIAEIKAKRAAKAGDRRAWKPGQTSD